jgi:uncharacterized SAM-dependent methyltransferase
LASLRSRRIQHKFHYESVKQTRQWLEIHRRFSPAVTDPGCALIYRTACATVADQATAGRVEVVGLGCGGGWKDALILRALAGRGISAAYWAVDSSAAMALTARENTVPDAKLLVCDLASPLGIPMELAPASLPPGCRRIITFFGMLPNFDQSEVLPALSSLLNPDDALLFSANLSPGDDYEAGVRAVLPQYDNEPTRDWLMAFLFDLGFERGDGSLQFSIGRNCGDELLRLEANFRAQFRREIAVENELFAFEPGESIRLFFSYRHTPEIIRRLIGRHGLELEDQWLNDTGEEGVFLARKRAPR